MQTPKPMITITEKIESLNNQANEILGYKSDDILRWISYLNGDGQVLIGYRTSCGKIDTTHKVFKIWLKTVKEIEKQGVSLVTENQKVGNGYATNKGGFWNEIKYSITK